jgi:hypothetical protein
VFDDETTTFLQSGCALIVGTVAPDGMPHAARAWGLDVEERGPFPVLRLLLDVDDQVTLDSMVAGGRVAVTATSVRNLRSMQLKGRSLGLDPDRPDDQERADRYTEQFFADITETDGTDPELLESFRPFGVRACRLRVEERFVQTPGPEAGVRIDTADAGA